MSKEQMQGAGTSATEQGSISTAPIQRKKRNVKDFFSAKRLAVIAVFVALSYAVSFLEIPLFPAAPFLKLDFGNVFIMLVGFLLGPIEGVIVCVLKESLRMLSSGSGGVGEIANMLSTTAFILLPSVLYRFKKGFLTVALSLVGACVLGTTAALLANRFINFPLYMGENAATVFQELFWVIVAFNAIKTSSVSIFTALLYKRLSNVLKKWKV
ncbi:MAG: ECF transporter S component [Clostridia bacterium]|nr:ECF transporter S component [Clostridia bacterium]